MTSITNTHEPSPKDRGLWVAKVFAVHFDSETGRKAQTTYGVSIFLQTPVSPSLGTTKRARLLGPNPWRKRVKIEIGQVLRRYLPSVI